MKALLVGNGFTSNLISTYSNQHMMDTLKEAIPELFCKADALFADFRMPVENPRLTSVAWGYCGDDLFCGDAPALDGPISGLPFNKELVKHIENTLINKGFADKSKELCETYFQTYSLIYETQQAQISSVENVLKIVSLFGHVNQFSPLDTQTVVSSANEIYFNGGANRLVNIRSNIHAPLKDWLSRYGYIFTTNYDCVLDDACGDPDKIMHLHGGFFYKDRYTRGENLLSPHQAYLVWGISGEDKTSQLKGGMTFPMEWPLEIPMSLFEQYINTLKTADIHCIDIFGYSGENDQHINLAITSNKALQELNYYCNPQSVNSEALRFELSERYQIKTHQKLNLRSWDEIWGVLL